MPPRSAKSGWAPDGDVDDLVLLTLGTGVGGGIISGGKMLQGYLGMAGELGHITVFPDGNPCGCGNRGCLEKHASATAITAMASMLRLGEGLSVARGLRSGARRQREGRAGFLWSWARRWASRWPRW